MIVDTNVVLRSFDRDAGPQGSAARARVEAARATGETLTVLAATVLEVVSVLESVRAGYGWERDVIAHAVEAVLDDPAFAVEHEDALREAAVSYRARAIDLHDCFISAIAKQRGDHVLSFDDDLRRLGNIERP